DYRTLLKQLHNYLTIAQMLRLHCNVSIVAYHYRLLFGQIFPPLHQYTADSLDNFPPLHTVPTSTRSSLAANRLKTFYNHLPLNDDNIFSHKLYISTYLLDYQQSLDTQLHLISIDSVLQMMKTIVT